MQAGELIVLACRSVKLRLYVDILCVHSNKRQCCLSWRAGDGPGVALDVRIVRNEPIVQ